MAKLSNEKESQIVELLQSGIPRFSEIARIVGCSRSPVARLAKKHGIKNDYHQQEYEPHEEYTLIHIIHHGDEYLAKIDNDDAEKCKAYGKWCMNSAGYVVNGNSGVLLSRFIVKCPDSLEVDHINHDVLDNRKCNLRIVTGSQNHFNQRLSRANRSGHRGVSWSKQRQKWCVYLTVNSGRITKRFDTYEEACDYADDIINEWHGDYKYRSDIDIANEICGSD